MIKTMRDLQRDYITRLLRITIEDYGKAHNLPFHEAASALARERPHVFGPWRKAIRTTGNKG